MSALTIIDLGRSSRTRSFVTTLSRLSLQFLRLSNRFDHTRAPDANPVLLISPGGSVEDLGWLPSARVFTPLSLLPFPASNQELQEAVFEATTALTTGPLSEVFPTAGGISLGQLNRLRISMYLRNAFLTLRAVEELFKRVSIRSIVVVSEDWTLVRSVQLQFGNRCRVSVLPSTLLRVLQGARNTQERFTRAGRVQRTKQWRTAAMQALDAQPESDLLLVSDSVPMEGMFASVENELAEKTPFLKRCKIQYGDQKPVATKLGVSAVLEIPRPDESTPVQRIYQRRLRTLGKSFGQPLLRQSVLGIEVSVSVTELVHSLSVSLDQQREHIDMVAHTLSRVRPKVIVVGNDRWWLGQTYVRLAQQQGIKTIAIQDGLVFNTAEWFWSVADIQAVSSSFAADILVDHGRDPAEIIIVGQPRYDSATRMERPKAHFPDSDEAELDREKRILFATQPLQDPAFVAGVLEALLAVPGVRVLLRPHPSEENQIHKMLAMRNADRVSYAGERDLFESLIACDLLVCQSSTVVLEASLIGTPSVTVNFTGMPDYAPYVPFGLAVQANSKTDLTELVKKVLSQPKGATTLDIHNAHAKAITALLGPADGRSAYRTAEMILKELPSSVFARG